MLPLPGSMRPYIAHMLRSEELLSAEIPFPLIATSWTILVLPLMAIIPIVWLKHRVLTKPELSCNLELLMEITWDAGVSFNRFDLPHFSNSIKF